MGGGGLDASPDVGGGGGGGGEGSSGGGATAAASAEKERWLLLLLCRERRRGEARAGANVPAIDADDDVGSDAADRACRVKKE